MLPRAELHPRQLGVGTCFRLMGESELFTFVTHPDVDGTNNEGSRTLRDPAQARNTGRTSKTTRGARRRTVLTSVLESLRLSLPVEDSGTSSRCSL